MSSSSPLSKQQLKAFCADLAPHLDGDLRTDAMTRALYATDASMYEIEPVALLLPRHAGDVQAALEAADARNVPVLPRGGGSSLAGQAVGAALVIDFTRHLDDILTINPDEQWARVQPGLVLDRLNAAAAEHGLMVGPDPASGNRATLGGMFANNSTGTHSIEYGMFIDHVRSAEVLLSDGSAATVSTMDSDAWQERMRRQGLEGDIYRSLEALLAQRGDVIRRDTPDHWRRNSGYRLEHLLHDGPRNLAHLLCGSEGTLAVTTELTLDLVPRPAHTALGIAHFETRSDALRAVTPILKTDPSAIELLDGVVVNRTREAPGFSHRLTFIEGDPGGALIVEYFGDTKAELTHRLDELKRAVVDNGRSYSVVRVQDSDAIDNVWSIRKEGLGLLMGVKSEYKPWAFIEDASVPVQHLADYIEELSRLIEATDAKAVYYAHASAGCLHVRPFINTKEAKEVEKMHDIAAGSAELVDKYDGVVSSEHGDGIVRSRFSEQLLGDELYDVYRQTKSIFDPKHLLNPGKVVDALPVTDHLRMGPDYQTRPFTTEMDFSADGGFAGAIELCNGNGACRKLDSGTMCPSFMATREEEDSTRGRANALRAALSGQLPAEELTSDRMYEVMDLCIQCKACKTECPSNVDMAKIKTEWLNKYWEDNSMPLRTRLFAHQPRLVRWISGTSLAPLANWASSQDVLRAAGEYAMGISQERPLPPFARQTFTQWYNQQSWPSGTPVVLFADTFNNNHTPHTARAAAEFLRDTGHAVQCPEASLCCGRTLLSKGLVSEAQLEALQVVEALYPFAERGIPVVGLEPSCILTLRDEFLDLLPGEPRAEAVAEVAYTFDEFVAQRADDGAFDDVDWSDADRQVLLHGHCHQKTLIGTDAAERALTLPDGYTADAVDAGCCGMAGAFGYEAEHVDVSRTMAERVLAPAVRDAAPNTLIAAPGFSCRSQIKDTTERVAQHPAEILNDALHA